MLLITFINQLWNSIFKKASNIKIVALSMFFYITKYTLSSLFLVLGAKDVSEKMAFAFVINVGL